MVMRHAAALPPLWDDDEEEGSTEDKLAAGGVAPLMLSKVARIGCMLNRRAVGLAVQRSSSRTCGRP